MKRNLNRSGVYSIVNTINSKIYVGSAKNIRLRWKAHRRAYRQQTHHNKHLLSSIQKYGLKHFKFEVLEFVDNPSELIQKEQYWIDYYKSYLPINGYNKCQFAGSPLGVKHSLAARMNMSAAHLGNKRSKEANEKIRQSQFVAVKQINIITGEEKLFGSMIEAEKLTGVTRQLISMCCRKITKSAKGFFWCFASEDFIKPIYERKRKCHTSCS